MLVAEVAEEALTSLIVVLAVLVAELMVVAV
jgi:hypothetical protein